MSEDNNPHPWAEFLKARVNVIHCLRKEMGYIDKKIAQDLSMDEIQVYFIRKATEKYRKTETS